jgi:hypothetical protein
MPKFKTDVELYRTALVYEAEMVSQALEEARIPYYRMEEDLGGLQLAMPAMPAQGLGIQYVLIVPGQMESQARALLGTLPLNREQDSGVFGFTSSDKSKSWFRAYAWVYLIVIASAFLLLLCSYFK